MVRYVWCRPGTRCRADGVVLDARRMTMGAEGLTAIVTGRQVVLMPADEPEDTWVVWHRGQWRGPGRPRWADPVGTPLAPSEVVWCVGTARTLGAVLRLGLYADPIHVLVGPPLSRPADPWRVLVLGHVAWDAPTLDQWRARGVSR